MGDSESTETDVTRPAATSLLLARWLSAIVFVVGALSTLGWILDITILAWPLPWLSPISFPTAVLFCLVAACLNMHTRPQRPVFRFATTVTCALAACVGAWTLGAYLWAGHLPFDAWMAGRQAAAGLHGLNRMSPVSAACFTLLGTALLLDSHPVLRGRALSQAIAAFGLLLALTSAIGYLYSVTSLVSLSDYKPIAPQTATAFLLSFCVLFLATPRKGVMHTILSPELGGILSRRLLAFVVLVPLLAGGIASAGLRLRLFDGTAAILFLTAAADLSLAGLLLTNAFSINASEKRRKSALVSLRESERTYRTLFELAADPMFLVDAGLTVLEANAAASHSLGRARVELKGREIAEIASTCAAEMTCNLAQAFERGSSAFESCARSSDGRDVPLEINARLIDFRGHPAVLVIARDLSERKAAERSLAEKESLLQQAQKMEAIGRLAGGVAHDFNNLLTVIMGYSELLIGKLPSQHDAQTDAFQIKACALKAAALTRQLLAFSRKQPASPRRVVLNDVLTEMSPLLRRLIGERIELVVRRQASRSSIRIDPSQLEQVVLNLSVNARDAMPGGGKLTIESRERTIQGVCPPYAPPPTDGVYVELVVEDTGTGIAPEIIPHIFEPFFTTKCGSQGTGLGLSTVYGIVTQNGGSIGVDSPPQGGASMRLLFPLLLGDPVEAEVEIDVRHSAVGRRETVLLIEDEISVRVYLGSVLRRAGYNVLEAEQGETALGTVRSYGGRIDAVVSDVVMPGIGAARLAEELSRLLPGARFLFMSGYDEGDAGEIGALCGRYDLIAKPFTATDLIDRLAVTADPGMTSAQATQWTQ